MFMWPGSFVLLGIYRVDGDYVQPNGIIGTPDGKTLYVADIGGRKTYVYEIQADGSLKNRKEFCSMGSDGMTIDEEGNVYFTLGKAVTVYDKTGRKILQIDVPEGTTNVCFGGKDMKTLFITAGTGFYSIAMRVKGMRSSEGDNRDSQATRIVNRKANYDFEFQFVYSVKSANQYFLKSGVRVTATVHRVDIAVVALASSGWRLPGRRPGGAAPWFCSIARRFRKVHRFATLG